jgi:hypothetical protein
VLGFCRLKSAAGGRAGGGERLYPVLDTSIFSSMRQREARHVRAVYLILVTVLIFTRWQRGEKSAIAPGGGLSG